VSRSVAAPSLSKRIIDARWCYAFMLPSVGLAALFTFWPIAASWYFSLLDWSGLSDDRPYIALGNYIELTGDPYFWSAFARSFLFMSVTVPVRLTVALIVALVLNDAALRLAPVFRTLFFLPVVTTSAIVGLLMTFVLSPFNGPINQALVGSGLLERPIDFLGDPATALWSVMGVSVWKGFGVSMVYWLAALQTIPVHQLEAARLDGAGRLQLVRYIMLPYLRPFAIVIVLITAVSALRVFDLVQTMTAGGPFFSSEVMEVYIYRNAFSVQGGTPRLGYASAAGVLFGLPVMLIAISQARALRWVREATRARGGDAATL
jgi:ABC-type sugar transport system permease subunit